MADFETKLRWLSNRGNPVGAEDLIERIEADLAGDPLVVVAKRREGTLMTKTQQSPTARPPSRYRGPAWAVTAFVAVLAVAAIYLAFPGDRDELADIPPPPTTVVPDTNPSSTTSATLERTVIVPWGYDPVARAVKLSLIVPDGWVIRPGLITTGDVVSGTHMRVGAGFVGNLFADRCQWRNRSLDPALGPTVEDLTTGFSTIWGSDATTAVDDMVDGFEGKSMVLTVPTDVDFSECDEQHFVGWAEAGSSEPSRWYQGPGQILRHWILDVNGVRLVIEASHFPQQSSEGLAELDRIVNSIQIVSG